MAAYFHVREEQPERPGGVTVSRTSKLLDSEFRITEYCWGEDSLWFVDADEFTEDERQDAYEHFQARIVQKLKDAVRAIKEWQDE